MSRPSPRGVSLLELLVVIGITTLLGLFILQLQLQQVQSYRAAVSHGEAENAIRLAQRRLIKVIRSAQPSGTGAFAIVQAQAQTLLFYANNDADPDIERIRYSLAGTSLRQGVVQPVGEPPVYLDANEVTSTVTTNIRNGAGPLFEYFDDTFTGAGAPLSQPVTATEVRLVRLIFTADDNPSADPPATTTTTYVRFRNLNDT